MSVISLAPARGRGVRGHKKGPKGLSSSNARRRAAAVGRVRGRSLTSSEALAQNLLPKAGDKFFSISACGMNASAPLKA